MMKTGHSFSRITKRISASKNGKVLAENFAALLLLQVAGYVFPFITLPYLSRTIGVEHFGDIAFATAIMVYCQTVVDYGFIFSAVRDIARCKEDKKEASAIFTRVMWARFFLVLVSFALLLLCILFIPKLYGMRLILLYSFFMVIGHALFPDWMFQALEKMKYITILNLLTKFLFTVLVFVVIREQDDYIYQPILTSLGFCISGIISLILLWKMGFRMGRFRIKEVLSTIRSNTDLFINQIVPNLYNSLSTIFLGFMSGSTANGIFDAGNRFNNISSQFIAIISRVFYPYLSRNIQQHSLYLKLHLGISFCAGLFLFVTAPLLIDLFFTEVFDEDVLVLRIMSCSLIFLSLSNVFGTNYLIVIGKEKELRNCTMVASIAGFFIMIPLVYYFSYIGAAFTIIIARGLIALLVTRRALHYKYIGGSK